MKPKRINNKSTFITNVNNPPVVIKNKLQKNHKNWLLIGIYSLVFGITVTTTVVLFIDNGVNYSDSNFNPRSNPNLWEQYYEKNKPDNKLIDLTRTKKYFDDDKVKEVVWEINTDKDKNSLSFNTVLNQIDKKLQEAGIESTDKSLPNGFFVNVINNPAVDFTINNQQVTNSSFVFPEEYNDSSSYDLKVSTSNEANAFGIQNKNISFVIKVKITNLLVFDISKLSLNLDHINFSYLEEKTTISKIIPYIKPKIEDAFVKALKLKLKVMNIFNNDYNITFVGNDIKTHDFSQGVDVKFQINSTKNSIKDNFEGTIIHTVKVSSKIIKLSDENDLEKKIENKYPAKESNSNNWLNIEFDNSSDKDNVDTSLTKEGLTIANSKISEVIKPQVINYLNDKYKEFNLKDADFKITSDLRLKDDLFNNALGKQCKIIVKPTEKNYKLSGQLEITITVHGKNTNFISNKQASDPKKEFSLDGIHLPDPKGNNFLQDGMHDYEQPKLLSKLVGDPNDPNSQTSKNSVLETIKNNSYTVEPTSFVGELNITYLLDEEKHKNVPIKINPSDITNGQGSEKNFWDVLNKTKQIWLKTSVNRDTSKNDRVLETVALVFTPTNDPNASPLWVLDLSDRFGKSIIDCATLVFSDFQFTIDYHQMS